MSDEKAQKERPKRSLNPEVRLAYTIAEVCEMTGLSDDTIRRKHHRGDITLRKSGRRTLVYKEDVEKLLASLPVLPRRAA